jgi:hypothetical protein
MIRIILFRELNKTVPAPNSVVNQRKTTEGENIKRDSALPIQGLFHGPEDATVRFISDERRYEPRNERGWPASTKM